jgi:hypothetical protein
MGLFLAAVPSTFAQATTFTEKFKNVTETFHDVNPCTGEGATVTITYNGVVHVTFAANGSFHITGTFTGDVVIVPDDPSQPTFTGHFTQWFGDNVNSKNQAATFTFTVIAKGSDGSRLRFHETAHFSVSATGVIVEFDKLRCG